MSDLNEILTRWQSNAEFREAFKKNPKEALKEAGLEVSPEDLEKILQKLKTNPQSQNEELDDRISK